MHTGDTFGHTRLDLYVVNMANFVSGTADKQPCEATRCSLICNATYETFGKALTVLCMLSHLAAVLPRSPNLMRKWLSVER